MSPGMLYSRGVQQVTQGSPYLSNYSTGFTLQLVFNTAIINGSPCPGKKPGPLLVQTGKSP